MVRSPIACSAETPPCFLGDLVKQVGKNLLCAIVLAQLGSACGPPEPECGPGFAAAGTSCVDVNECADNNGGCNENRECLNDEGSFSCGECRAGFLKFGDTQCEDVDECADGTAHCRDDENCTNLPGTFSCSVCPTGFLADGRGNCVDIDECLTDNGGCDVLRDCVNEDGGFSCSDCAVGFANDGALRCTDVDECLTANGGCDVNRSCINSEGSVSCGECRPGFVTFGATGCEDIDECSAGTDDCATNKVCNNAAGSFSCDDCPSGFVTDNQGGCSDVDECAVSDGGCAPGQRSCVNDVGTFHCTDCPAGFANDGPTGCRDVDECLTGNGGCVNRACENLVGSRQCGACSTGFAEATATRCDDIDECTLTPNGGCDFSTTCINTPGSRTCGDCPGGLVVNGAVLTGETACPGYMLVEILGFTFGPGPGDGTTWDGTGSVPASTYQAIANAISGFNPLVGLAAEIGGPLLASSVDAPDSYGTFQLSGDDDELNFTRGYNYFENSNDFMPAIDVFDFSPTPPNFCGITTRPAFAMKIGAFNGILISLQDADNLFDDDMGSVNISESQAIDASNAMNGDTGAPAGSVYIDTSEGQDHARILEVQVLARPQTYAQLVDAESVCP